MQRREAALLVFAAAIFAVSLFTGSRRELGAAAPDARGTTPPGARSPAREERTAFDADEWLQRLKSRAVSTEPRGPGLFGGANWNPPPAAAPALAKPEQAPTPPFPFRLLGRMTLDGTTVVLLTKGEQTYPAKPGDVIEQHRVEQIGEDELRVTYLPNGESRNYRYEELYPAAVVAGIPAAPSAPAVFSPVPPGETSAALIQRQAIQPQAQAAPAAAPDPRKPASAEPAPPAMPMNPINPVPGAGEPIGGMVISPTPPGAGMVITPTPPGAGMIMTPTPPGALMQMTPGNAAAGPTTSAPPQ